MLYKIKEIEFLILILRASLIFLLLFSARKGGRFRAQQNPYVPIRIANSPVQWWSSNSFKIVRFYPHTLRRSFMHIAGHPTCVILRVLRKQSREKYLKHTLERSALNEFACEVRFIVKKTRALRYERLIFTESKTFVSRMSFNCHYRWKKSRLKIANAH